MATPDLFRHDFVVSIRPDYAAKIVEGKKTAELRRRFPPDWATGALAYIYASSPLQAIIGYAEIKNVERLPIDVIWHEFGAAACIAEDEFRDYFSGLHEGYVVVLDEAKKFREGISLAELRERFDFSPPQSFCYADDSWRTLLDRSVVP